MTGHAGDLLMPREKKKRTNLSKQVIEYGPLPKFIIGRVRKDGKPDRRFTKHMLMLQQSINQRGGRHYETH